MLEHIFDALAPNDLDLVLAVVDLGVARTDDAFEAQLFCFGNALFQSIYGTDLSGEPDLGRQTGLGIHGDILIG